MVVVRRRDYGVNRYIREETYGTIIVNKKKRLSNVGTDSQLE
jgi:hypothetical protein